MNRTPFSAPADTVFVAFDTETTGLSPVEDRVVELAAVAFRKDGTEAGLFESLVDPGLPIPPDMSRIHGITDAMVAGKPRIEAVLPEFVDFAGDAVLVAHNAPYDVSMLLVPLLRMPAPSRPGPRGNLVLDTCTLARTVFPGAPNYRLATVAGMLGIPHERAHRALADVVACKAIFLKVLEKCGEEATLDRLVERNGSELRFGTTPGMLALLPKRNDPGGLLAEALKGAAPVRIRYEAGTKGIAPRPVTPITLVMQGDMLHLLGHCHLDRSIKSFRIDLVSAVYPPTP